MTDPPDPPPEDPEVEPFVVDLDPFTILVNAIWAALDASGVGDIVKVGNRIKFRSANALQMRISNADLPELMLLPVSGTGNIHESSCSSSIIRQFAFYISTGDQRLSHDLFPLEWEIFKMLANWQSTLGGILWKGITYIKRLDLTGIANALSDAEKNRGITGWSASWSFEVEMHFSHNDILEA